MDIVDPQGSNDPNLASAPAASTEGEVPQMDLERTLPRQLSTGTQRGTQTLSGEQLVTDPINNNQVITTSGVSQNTVYSNPATQTPQIVIGRLPDDTYGMRVAPPNVDVLKASDDQLIFNSSQNVFKVVASGTYSLTGSSNISFGTTQTESIVHNLGSVPAFVVYSNAPDGGLGGGFQGGNGIMNLPIHYMLPAVAGGKPWFWLQVRVDITRLYFDLVCVGGTANDLSNMTWTFKYYLLQESAN